MTKFKINTQGHNDIINLTDKIRAIVSQSPIQQGLVLISCPGSTVGLTTIEDEPELLQDFKEFLEKLAPSNKTYRHDRVWGEKNGFAHLLSALVKPFLTIPLENKELVLGQWQQIVLIDFDSRPRQREIIIKIIKTNESEN